MARTSIGQVAALVTTNCSDPRVDEATKWNQVQTSLKAVIQQGQTLVSAWGGNLNAYENPILGGSRNLSEIFAPVGTVQYKVRFEQPTLRTSGAITVADKFLLHTRFVLAHYQAVTNASSNADIYGRVRFLLENAGGSQVLADYTSTDYAAIISPPSTTVAVASDDYVELELNVEGTLNNSLMPSVGSSFDSNLVLEISGYLHDRSPALSEGGDSYALPTMAFAPYLGIAGATFRIFNPAT